MSLHGFETGHGVDSQERTWTRMLFRAVNERIERLHADVPDENSVDDWICECTDERCFERIELSRREFAAVSRAPGRFAVKPGHESAGLDRVIESSDRYVVVSDDGKPPS